MSHKNRLAVLGCAFGLSVAQQGFATELTAEGRYAGRLFHSLKDEGANAERSDTTAIIRIENLRCFPQGAHGRGFRCMFDDLNESDQRYMTKTAYGNPRAIEQNLNKLGMGLAETGFEVTTLECIRTVAKLNFKYICHIVAT